MKVTQWFSPDIDPVYVGWYHTTINNQNPADDKDNEASLCWWWDGMRWCLAPGFNALPFQNRWWRGMAE